jgi:hypothetical protein
LHPDKGGDRGSVVGRFLVMPENPAVAKLKLINDNYGN